MSDGACQDELTGFRMNLSTTFDNNDEAAVTSLDLPLSCVSSSPPEPINQFSFNTSDWKSCNKFQDLLDSCTVYNASIIPQILGSYEDSLSANETKKTASRKLKQGSLSDH